jgi:hypothetical protein
VLIHAPDRLNRKYAYQVLLMEELARHGVETVFIKAPQTATPEDQLLVQFQGMICDDSRIEIDNNAAERAVRCVALGRKNFLFAGSDGGGQSAAAFYSLPGSAKLNGHNLEAFLREVLDASANIRSTGSPTCCPGT